MAPTMAIADQSVGKLWFGVKLREKTPAVADDEVVELRRRNEELEREVRERRERESELKRELERTREKLMTVEEAEERLCAQLGELEAEAVGQARDYHRRIQDLSRQLQLAQNLITSSSSSQKSFE